jgi:phosphotransferase system IIB component
MLFCFAYKNIVAIQSCMKRLKEEVKAKINNQKKALNCTG